MRVKIVMEMSGNEYHDLLRRVPKAVAQKLKNNTVALPVPEHTVEQAELLWSSVEQLIEAKKR